MRTLLVVAALLSAAPALAQSGSDKLPPANPLPYAQDDASAPLAAANRLLAALSGGGGEMLAQVRPEGSATAVVQRPDGTKTVKRMSWAEFAENLKPDGHRYEERLIDPAVDVDGDIAMVWSPYVLLIDGKVAHCGTDHFDLVRENGVWKVLNITWNQRKTECPAQ